MNHINSEQLKSRIAALELEAEQIELDMRERVNRIYEGMNPVNAIKSVFKSVNASPDTKKELLNTALNVGVGLLGSKLLMGGKGGVIKRVAGAALQMGAGTNIVKNLGVWKRFATSLFKKEKKKKNVETIPFDPVAV